jgi:PAS domain S-box-containing protein
MPCAMYLLNYQTQSFTYFSEEVENLIGYTSDEMTKNSHSWALNQIHPDDLKEFTGSVFEDFVTYSHSLNKQQLEKSRFSIYYRFQHKEGHYVQFLDNHIVIETDESNNPLLVLGICTDITPHTKEPKVIFKISEYDSIYGERLIQTKSFPHHEVFTKKEAEIIYLLQKGTTNSDIADFLNISLETVCNTRKNLLERFNFNNTTELLSYCLINGIEEPQLPNTQTV